MPLVHIRRISMKFVLALLVVLCFQTQSANAYQQNNNEIRYNPKERLAMPASKSNGLKAATNVVIKEVEFSKLPEFIKGQADFIANDCTQSPDNKKLMKFYRYVSDLTRDAGFSSNYLIDLSGLAGKTQQACMVDSACTKDGCMLVGFLSTAYEKWERHFFVRNKSWKHTNVENPKSKSVLTVLDLTQVCLKPGSSTDGDSCLSRRLWLENGLKEYNPNAVDSFFQQPTEDDVQPTEAAPDQPVPPSGSGAGEAPADSSSEVPADAPTDTTADEPPVK